MHAISAALVCMSALTTHLLSTVAADPKVLHFPIGRSSRSASSSSLAKRSHVLSTLTNEELQASDELFYYLNITVGTPPQKFGVQIDTGSSDTWLISAADTDDCEDPEFSLGCDFGLYNQNVSSTYVLLQSGGFEIEYADSTSISGDFITESVGFDGNVTVKEQILGLANQTSGTTYGLMGVGFDINEANASYGGPTYPNIIHELKNQGFINVRAYSLWLDDLESTTGSILFGGVDRSRYLGDLIGLPIQLDVSTEIISSFTVSLTSVGFVDSKKKDMLYSGLALPALLDSGTSFTYLPDQVAASILNGIGVAQDENSGLNLAPCSLNQTNANITFGFGGNGGQLIMVALSEFVSDPVLQDDGSIMKIDGEDVCLFGIMAGGDNTTTILGDTFLRSAYVVYDIDNHLIGMANTNFNPGASDIIEYEKGQLSIPGVSATAAAAVPSSLYAEVSETGSFPTITAFPSGTFHLSTGATSTSTGAPKAKVSAASAQSLMAAGPIFALGLGLTTGGLTCVL